MNNIYPSQIIPTTTLQATFGGSTGYVFPVALAVNALLTLGATGKFLTATGATTGNSYLELTNTGNSTLIGIESSVGGTLFTGSTAYAAVIGTQGGVPLQFATTNQVWLTLSAAGLLTTTATGNFLIASGATTGNSYLDITNTGNSTLFGVESSAGGTIVTNSSAYATVLATASARSLQLGTNNTAWVTINSAGQVFFNELITPGNNGATGTSSIFGGNGSPSGTVTAPNGSLYLRFDGGSSARLYVNTTGASTSGTTWTAVTI